MGRVGVIDDEDARVSGSRPSAEDPILRILVADDNALLRDTLGEWLTHKGGVEVAALASSGSEAVMLTESASPDVAILDLRMPDMDGLEVARHIAARHPDVAMILYTSEEAAHILDAAKEAGVRGFVRKGDDLDLLLEAIHDVAAGNVAFPPSA